MRICKISSHWHAPGHPDTPSPILLWGVLNASSGLLVFFQYPRRRQIEEHKESTASELYTTTQKKEAQAHH
eukprot:1141434-Pelagomonas_calceolata.AAC.2